MSKWLLIILVFITTIGYSQNYIIDSEFDDIVDTCEYKMDTCQILDMESLKWYVIHMDNRLRKMDEKLNTEIKRNYVNSKIIQKSSGHMGFGAGLMIGGGLLCVAGLASWIANEHGGEYYSGYGLVFVGGTTVMFGAYQLWVSSHKFGWVGKKFVIEKIKKPRY